MSADEAARFCGKFAEELGFPKFMLALRLLNPPCEPVESVLTNFSRSWLRIYQDRNYAVIDPVVERVMRSAQPVVWRQIERRSDNDREFFKEAAACGMPDGLTVPWYSPRGEYALLSLTGASVPGDASPRDALMSSIWLFLGRNFGTMREAVLLSQRQPAQPPLTDRQQNVLSLIGTGMTMKQIAQTMGLHVRTIEDSLKRAMQRLRASSREQAIVYAIALGQIGPTAGLKGFSRPKLVLVGRKPSRRR